MTMTNYPTDNIGGKKSTFLNLQTKHIHPCDKFISQHLADVTRSLRYLSLCFKYFLRHIHAFAIRNAPSGQKSDLWELERVHLCICNKDGEALHCQEQADMQNTVNDITPYKNVPVWRFFLVWNCLVFSSLEKRLKSQLHLSVASAAVGSTEAQKSRFSRFLRYLYLTWIFTFTPYILSQVSVYFQYRLVTLV